jgi:hypothetical protein
LESTGRLAVAEQRTAVVVRLTVAKADEGVKTATAATTATAARSPSRLRMVEFYHLKPSRSTLKAPRRVILMLVAKTSRTV